MADKLIISNVLGLVTLKSNRIAAKGTYATCGIRN